MEPLDTSEESQIEMLYRALKGAVLQIDRIAEEAERASKRAREVLETLETRWPELLSA